MKEQFANRVLSKSFPLYQFNPIWVALIIEIVKLILKYYSVCSFVDLSKRVKQPGLLDRFFIRRYVRKVLKKNKVEDQKERIYNALMQSAAELDHEELYQLVSQIREEV